MPESENGKAEVKTRSFYDYTLIFIIVFLCAFGMVMLYSITSYSSAISSGNSFAGVKKQLIIMVGAFVAMLIISKIDYHWYNRFMIPLYVLTFLSLIGLFFVGSTVNGSTRWYVFGPVSIQPAEIAKIVLILAMAWFLNNYSQRINAFKMKPGTQAFSRPSILIISAVLIVMGFFLPVAKNNLSSGIIIFGIGCVIFFVGTKWIKLYIGLVAVGVVALVAALKTGVIENVLQEYQMDRIRIWLDPTLDPTGDGYQILQGLYSIGSGGFFGKGLGQSIQKYTLPEASNDMIFGIICEELGLFGAGLVIILFALLLWRLAMIAMNAPDLQGTLIVTGIFAHIAMQVMFNIAVVANVMPNTGISLPFISSGGTAILFTLCEMGLALNVSSQIRVKI